MIMAVVGDPFTVPDILEIRDEFLQRRKKRRGYSNLIFHYFKCYFLRINVISSENSLKQSSFDISAYRITPSIIPTHNEMSGVMGIIVTVRYTTRATTTLRKSVGKRSRICAKKPR